MRGLKIAVVVMGVLLVVGFAALIAVIAHRVAHPPTPAPPAAVLAALPASAQPFAGSPVDLPADARVEAMAAGDGRLVLDIVLSDGNRQLLVIDLASGRPLGKIPLRRTP